MNPPENANGPGANRAERENIDDTQKVASFRANLKSEILRQLSGRVFIGSDFEARRLRARENARRK